MHVGNENPLVNSLMYFEDCGMPALLNDVSLEL
jgi:hypothetical protein